MAGNYLFACVILIALGSSMGASIMEGNYNVTAYCSIVKIGTSIASIVDCSTYYSCYSQGPVKNNCGTGYSFDLNSQQCKPSSQVNCFYGVANPCVGKDNVFVPNVQQCGGWIKCTNGAEAYRGNCPSGQIFSGGSCVYGQCNPDSNTNSLTSACQVIPLNSYFGSTISCSTWQACTSNGLVSGECSNGMVFNAPKGQCDYKSVTPCNWVTGQDINPDPGTCNKIGNLKPNINTCSDYFYCNGKSYTARSCQYGYYFDVPSSNCLPRQAADPTPSCDRCLFTTAQFVNTAGSNCQGYAICKNGASEGTSTCPLGTYFSETRQGCVDDIDLDQYAETHGACSGASGSTGTTQSPGSGPGTGTGPTPGVTSGVTTEVTNAGVTKETTEGITKGTTEGLTKATTEGITKGTTQ